MRAHQLKRPGFIVLFALLAILICPEKSNATTILYDAIDTPVVSIIGVTDFQTYGSDMLTLTVTAKFSNGSTDTEAWNKTSSTGGAATGQGWTLAESGDTYTSNWSLSVIDRTLQISSLTLTGFVATDPVTHSGTTFDRTLPDTGTVGSSNGHDFSVSGASGAWNAIQATYHDPIRVDGLSVQHDEYRQLNLTFGSLVGAPFNTHFVATPFVFGDSLTFVQDTDTIGLPEPGSMALLGTGLLLIFIRRLAGRRR